jgi:hypothetical protein
MKLEHWAGLMEANYEKAFKGGGPPHGAALLLTLRWEAIPWERLIRRQIGVHGGVSKELHFNRLKCDPPEQRFSKVGH